MSQAPLNTFFAQVPLQEQIWDKDLNVPLAAGVVSFFSDLANTVPKNVYALNNTMPYEYISVGSVLTLSSIGTFVNPNDGTNFIPFMWPFVGDPNVDEATSPEAYYITVYSSTGIEQFTVHNWPPNSSGGGSSGGGTTSVLVTPYTSGTPTWTINAKTQFVMFECIGGGGGGAGCSNSSASQCNAGSGGGAGGYSRTTVNAAIASPSQVVTVGAGGTSGTTGANPGGAGGTSSVGSLCIANGGGGGLVSGGSAAIGATLGGAGAAAGTGDIAGTGQAAQAAIYVYPLVISQQAGCTAYGAGGSTHGQNNGGAATGFGAGGQGGYTKNGGGDFAGGAGAPGFVIITEYLSS